MSGAVSVVRDIPAEQRITLTPQATEHIKRQLRTHPSAIGLRIGVTRTGCSGLAYVVDLVERANDDDLCFAMDEGLSIYVDPKSFEIIKGTRLDFVREGLSKHFRFDNPNVKAQCGCGESFSV